MRKNIITIIILAIAISAIICQSNTLTRIRYRHAYKVWKDKGASMYVYISDVDCKPHLVPDFFYDSLKRFTIPQNDTSKFIQFCEYWGINPDDYITHTND